MRKELSLIRESVERRNSAEKRNNAQLLENSYLEKGKRGKENGYPPTGTYLIDEEQRSHDVLRRRPRMRVL